MVRDWIDVVTVLALALTLFADVVFICCNHAWTAWRFNAWGRHVMLFSYVIAGVLTLGLARLLFGDYPARRLLLMGFYTALALVMIQRVWLVLRGHLRAQRDGRRQPRSTGARAPDAGDPGADSHGPVRR